MSNLYYLAGPMRGIPEYNFPAFFAAAKVLREKGYEIISPAEMDTEAGFDSNEGDWTSEDAKAALIRDMTAIANGRGIILLPGWQNSKGCWQEMVTARYLGREVWLYTPEKLVPCDANLPLTYREYLRSLI